MAEDGLLGEKQLGLPLGCTFDKETANWPKFRNFAFTWR